MKRMDGQTTSEADETEEEGRSTAFWIAIAVVAVVGVLVVLTVIAAAVIGSFVLGIESNEEQQPPRALWVGEYDAASETLTLTHEEGDVVQGERLGVTVEGVERPDWSAPSGQLRAGDELTVPDVQPGDEVELLWTDPEDGSTHAIGGSIAVE